MTRIAHNLQDAEQLLRDKILDEQPLNLKELDSILAVICAVRHSASNVLKFLPDACVPAFMRNELHNLRVALADVPMFVGGVSSGIKVVTQKK